MTTEIQLHAGAILARTLDEARSLAGDAAASKLFLGLGREAALVILLTGQELGLSPMASLRGINVVKGKPFLSADLMVAVVKRSPLCAAWRTVESTPLRCTIETTRAGDPCPTTKTWTMEDAKRADLAGGDNWRKYPAQMLRHRCAADLAREVYPDLVFGFYDPDEIPEATQRARVEVTSSAPNESPTRPAIDVFREEIDGFEPLSCIELFGLYREHSTALQAEEQLGTAKHAVTTALASWGLAVTESDVQTLLSVLMSTPQATPQFLKILGFLRKAFLAEGPAALLAWYREHAAEIGAMEQTRDVTTFKAVVARTWCKRAGVETKQPNVAFKAALDGPDPDGPRGTTVTPPAAEPANTNGAPVEAGEANTAQMVDALVCDDGKVRLSSPSEVFDYLGRIRSSRHLEAWTRKHGQHPHAVASRSAIAARLVAIDAMEKADGMTLTLDGALASVTRWAAEGPRSLRKAA